MVKKTVLGILVGGLLAANAGAVWAVDSGPGTARIKAATPRGTITPSVRSTVQLVSYGDCSQVLAGLRAEAVAEVGPYGWASGGYANGFYAAKGTDGVAMPTANAAAVPAASGATSSGAAASTSSPNYSTTNNQEAGVDEPDVTKTDGHLMVVLRSNPAGIEIADVSAGTPRLESFLPISGAYYGGDNGMFLAGDNAVVLAGDQWSSDSTGSTPATKAYVVSLSDPAHPAVARTFDFQGSLQGARLINGQVVLVLSNQPQLPFVTPSGPGTAAEADATAANKSVIANAPLADFLPGVRDSSVGATVTPSCGNVVHPTVASGLGTTSVVSFSPTADAPGHETTIVGNASTVYASSDSVYVATSPWQNQVVPMPRAAVSGTGAGGGVAIAGPAAVVAPSNKTDIYKFSIADPAHPTYVASGEVQGELIGQYALSDYQGYLRVATTVGAATPAPGEGSAPAVLSDSRVTELAVMGTQLVAVGQVTGLGQGEKIYSVRYEGPLAYVVTFNQIDPLYVLDLNNPRAPKLDGEVALTGYSSFLQPLDGNLLFGIGRGVTSTMAPTSLQLSVFDVSNPQSPVLKSRQEVPNSQSMAEQDPHALLWWPATRDLVLPVSNQTGQNLVDVWHVSTDGTLTLASKLTSPTSSSASCGTPAGPAGVPSDAVACYAPSGLERSLVVGSNLWTVTDAGMMANEMTTWTRNAWLPFG